MRVPMPSFHPKVKRGELTNGCRSFNHVTNGGGVPVAEQDSVREPPAEALMLGGGRTETTGCSAVVGKTSITLNVFDQVALLQSFSSLPSLHCPTASHLYARGTHTPLPVHWNCEGRQGCPPTMVAAHNNEMQKENVCL